MHHSAQNLGWHWFSSIAWGIALGALESRWTGCCHICAAGCFLRRVQSFGHSHYQRSHQYFRLKNKNLKINILNLNFKQITILKVDFKIELNLRNYLMSVFLTRKLSKRSTTCLHFRVSILKSKDQIEGVTFYFVISVFNKFTHTQEIHYVIFKYSSLILSFELQLKNRV